MKKKKEVTLESIAESIGDLHRSVNDVTEAINGITNTMVTKQEFNTRLNKVDKRLDDIEAEVSPYSRRIDRLEDKVRKISVKIGLDD